MICTNIEQSQQLVRLGLDPVTADMCFEMEKGNWTLNVGKKSAQVNRGLAIPAWSLSALLEVMPKMEADSTVCLGRVSTLIRCKSHDFMWQHDSTAVQPIVAAYEMVCWLLENGYIKKGD